MANEAVLVTKQEDAIDFIVSDSTGIEKGTILKIADPMTASASSGAADQLAGIAAREKIASDGRTRLSVYRKGIFQLKASGSIAVGDILVTDTYPNHVKSGNALLNLSGACILGTSLETASTGETFMASVNITGVNG